MAKMRLEVSVSVAIATPATVNHPKVVVAGNVYHVVNTDIPAKQNG
jgi:predicted RecA/RadA family phage recombinase